MPHPSGRPWIIAHRGACRQARENTLAAFRLAAELGADSVELDVRRTADGVLVVHHDAAIPEAGEPIVAQTRSELRTLAPWVPDLDEALAASSGMWVDVEIKNDPRDPDWDPDRSVATAIADAHRGADIVVTSFDPGTVAVAARAGLRTGLLLMRGVDPRVAAADVAGAGHEFMLPHYSTLAGERGPEISSAARNAGVEIVAWTVDDPADMRWLTMLGIGGIATNLPDVARSVLEHDDGKGR